MKGIKKLFILVIISILCLFAFYGCTESNSKDSGKRVTYHQEEQPHLYWKDIKVKVVNNNAYTWFASTRFYKQTITVKSDEYNLTKTFDIVDSGAFNCPEYFNARTGDVINAELYSWKMDSTGKIVKREIAQLK
jgi:hypothetical protein